MAPTTGATLPISMCEIPAAQHHLPHPPISICVKFLLLNIIIFLILPLSWFVSGNEIIKLMDTKVISTGIIYSNLHQSYVRPESERPRLSEVSTCENVPAIDLGSDSRIVQQIGHGSKNYGFFQMTYHGVSAEAVKKMLGVAGEFFQLPVEEKLKLYSDGPSKTMRLSTGFNVNKEKVHNWRDYLRLHCYPLGKDVPEWPPNPPSFKLPEHVQQTEWSCCRASFLDLAKSETHVSPWIRAMTLAARVGKGLLEDNMGQHLYDRQWVEKIDHPHHRYGHNLLLYHDIWSQSNSPQPFFFWLDHGDGKEVNLEGCPRTKLQRECVKYLGPKERSDYEVVIKKGKFVYKKGGEPLTSTEGSKLIFVLSTSRKLYVGEKKKGFFHHSSFLAGAATIASGRLAVRTGILQEIWPRSSGHYRPKYESSTELCSFLKEHNVDMTNVKKYAVDEDHSA
ncbi:hypothetical protein SLA2020_290380 [Shorea laevis]